MTSFIITLFILLTIFIACVFWTATLYKRNKKYEKEYKGIKENRKIISISRKRKKENRLLLMSFGGVVISVVGTLYTLFNSVPAPTIYPLDNDVRVYEGKAEVIIESDDFIPFLHTYYSLDGSDPKNGNIYKESFTINKSTTVVAKNRFLHFWWSEPSRNTYRFENIQNTYVSDTYDSQMSIEELFAYIITFFIMISICISLIRR